MKKILLYSFLLFCSISITSMDLKIQDLRDKNKEPIQEDSLYSVSWREYYNIECDGQLYTPANHQRKDMFQDFGSLFPKCCTHETAGAIPKYHEEIIYGRKIPDLINRLNPNAVRDLSIEGSESCCEYLFSCCYTKTKEL